MMRSYLIIQGKLGSLKEEIRPNLPECCFCSRGKVKKAVLESDHFPLGALIFLPLSFFTISCVPNCIDTQGTDSCPRSMKTGILITYKSEIIML